MWWSASHNLQHDMQNGIIELRRKKQRLKKIRYRLSTLRPCFQPSVPACNLQPLYFQPKAGHFQSQAVDFQPLRPRFQPSAAAFNTQPHDFQPKANHFQSQAVDFQISRHRFQPATPQKKQKKQVKRYSHCDGVSRSIGYII